MGVYAYCVVPRGHEPPATLRGLGDAPVASLEADGVAVWISRMDRPDGSAVDQIKAHNAVVEAAVTDAITPVPLRFGQWVEDEVTLLAATAEKAESYQEKLREFAGCLEFGIRVLDPQAQVGAQDVRPAKGTSGLEYMQALRDSTRQADLLRASAERVRSTIEEKVRKLVRAEQEEPARTPHAVVTVSHLVPRENFDEYRERARQLREVFPQLRLLLSGPWPPYSFAA